MKPLVAIGLLLVVLGVVALAVPAVTFFTTERVADVGIFKVDIQRPHTIVLNPVAGALLVVAGLGLLVIGRRPAAA
jgi:hypothetical protein